MKYLKQLFFCNEEKYESQMKVDFTWDLLKTVRVFFFLSFPPLPLLPSLKVMNLLFTFRADVCSVCTFSDIIFFLTGIIVLDSFIQMKYPEQPLISGPLQAFSTLDAESFWPRSPLDTLSSAAMSSSSSDKFSTDPGRGNG